MLNFATAPFRLEQLYPHREDVWEEGGGGHICASVLVWLQRAHALRIQRFIRLVEDFEHPLQGPNEEEPRQRVHELRRGLRRDRLKGTMVAQAHALTRLPGRRQLGMRHIDLTIKGCLVMLVGIVVEMHMAQGKSVMAKRLPWDITVAGLPVHVAAASHDLVAHDCEWTRLAYPAMGLKVSFVAIEVSQADQQVAHRFDVAYVGIHWSGVTDSLAELRLALGSFLHWILLLSGQISRLKAFSLDVANVRAGLGRACTECNREMSDRVHDSVVSVERLQLLPHIGMFKIVQRCLGLIVRRVGVLSDRVSVKRRRGRNEQVSGDRNLRPCWRKSLDLTGIWPSHLPKGEYNAMKMMGDRVESVAALI